MPPYKVNCPHCQQNISFEPETATQTQWLELNVLLRSPQISTQRPASDILLGVESDLRRCKDELDRQKLYIVTLENQRKMLERHVETAKALAAPIRRVPPEILSRIFSLCCLENSVSRYTISIPGLTLAQVCFHWNQIVLSDQGVWSAISLDFGHSSLGSGSDTDGEDEYSSESMTGAIEFLLQHSGSHPLTFDIYHTDDINLALAQAWSQIKSHSRRWRMLSVTVDDSYDALAIPFGSLAGKLPALRHLQMASDDDLEPATISLDFLKELPSLCSIVSDEETCLETVPMQNIRLLELSSSENPLATLSRCSQLQEARIGCSALNERKEHTGDPIQLSTLRILEFTESGDSIKEAVALLSDMTLPGLTSLSFLEEHHDEPSKSFPVDAFRRFIARSACTITSFCWQTGALKIKEWTSLFRSLPALESLSLKLIEAPEDDPILDLFFEQMSGTRPLLPRLKRLSITVYEDISLCSESFLNAIQSRWVNGSLCEDVACLRYLFMVVSDLELDPDVIEALQRLVTAGMTIAIEDSTERFVVG
ncbi:hypothetical protein C8J56DRAFT_401489 [Mycena floridula]|nr:hypothetical protein C8J56DRAFT_401489 [Mycena floridula]